MARYFQSTVMSSSKSLDFSTHSSNTVNGATKKTIMEIENKAWQCFHYFRINLAHSKEAIIDILSRLVIDMNNKISRTRYI